MRQATRRLFALAAGIVVALGATFTVLAQGPNPLDKLLTGETVVVPAGTTVDHDVYAFGSTITIAGTVNGDLVAAAARVVINGTVTGDVFAAGSEVIMTGAVGGDFRAAGAQIRIDGQVAEDAAVLGSDLLLGSAGRVQEDVLFAATDVILEGDVAGGIAGTATDYRRRGNVGGTEQVTLASPPDQPAADRTAALAIDALRQYIVVVLVGLAFLRFAPRLFWGSVERVRRQPLAASGVGVIALLGYVAALIGLIVLMLIVGLVFGQLDFSGVVAIDIVGTVVAGLGLTLGVIVFAAFVADAIVGMAIGRLIAISDGPWADAIRLSIGAAMVVVVTSFPGVGGIVKLLVILVALGAFCNDLWDQRRQRRLAATPVPPVAA